MIPILLHPVVEEDFLRIRELPLDWKRFHRKTVLVSGGAGFLPAYLVEFLLWLNTVARNETKVVCLVRNEKKARERFAAYAGRTDLALIVGDVSKPLQFECRCDFILHAASQASPKYYGKDPVGTMAANLSGTMQLLELARTWKSEGFLYFSSGEVYGQVSAERVPTGESDYGYIDILNPRSCYAESKRAAETLAVSYAHQFQVPAYIVRPFHTYGPGMALDDGRVYADFVRDVIQHRDILVQGDGKAVRAFCYLGDAVGGFLTVLLKGRAGQAYNVGNPAAAVSIRGLAEVLAGLFPELGLKVSHAGRTDAGYLASPISINSPNVDLIAQLGWQPTTSLRDGFERTIRSFVRS
ncbi:MAG: NAD-dependent epimerase/dehydratase family protein [Verrucomicrobia bacterium]|nr:NAD-dependent epimerase/dehydratase family protein [Verrucomicrobiota bacterium]